MLMLVLLFAGTGLSAQNGLTPEKLWELGRVSMDAVSPDGEMVLYGVTRYDLEANRGNRDLFIMPASGGQVRKITAFDGSEYNALFRPDGSKIGFLSGESGSSQLWEMNPDGSDLTQVTDIDGGISGFMYSPTMDKILFAQEVKIDAELVELYPDLPKAEARVIDDLMYRHWNEWEDGYYSHVFLMDYEDGAVSGEPMDLMEGERFDSPLKPFGGMEQIAWSPDGFLVAYTCKKMNGVDYAVSTNSDIYLYDLQGDNTTNLTEGMNGYDMNPAFSPDGTTIIWNSMEKPGYESDRNRLFAATIGTNDVRELSASLDQNVNGAAFSTDGSKIYFTSELQGTIQLCQMNADGTDYSQVSSGEHNIYGFGETNDGFVIQRVTISSPAELYSLDSKGRMEQITRTNESILATVKMGNVEKRMVKATDGEEILTWVIYPPDFDESKEYPALLYCQGGPQSTVSQFFSYRWNFQLMAANGYIVVAPNRRGLPSFGQQWNEDISLDWGGQAMDDLLSAIDDVKEEPYVDADRLGAVGASFGGYSVYWLAGNHEERFKALISHCGLFNLESWYGTTEELFFANQDIGGPYWETNRNTNTSYQIHSPHKYVGNWDAPILVIHGEKDFRVPIGEGIQAFHAAQIQGVPSRFLYFPNEGHWVLKPQNGLLWHRVFFDWLDRYLAEEEMEEEE